MKNIFTSVLKCATHTHTHTSTIELRMAYAILVTLTKIGVIDRREVITHEC